MPDFGSVKRLTVKGGYKDGYWEGQDRHEVKWERKNGLCHPNHIRYKVSQDHLMSSNKNAWPRSNRLGVNLLCFTVVLGYQQSLNDVTYQMGHKLARELSIALVLSPSGSLKVLKEM